MPNKFQSLSFDSLSESPTMSQCCLLYLFNSEPANGQISLNIKKLTLRLSDFPAAWGCFAYNPNQLSCIQ